jgi:16S rRNA (uracil1498-N3)-methyltransferase
MVVPFVLVEQPLDGIAPGSEVVLPADEVHHLAAVLRLRPGAALEIADGSGRRGPATFTGTAARLDGVPVSEPPATPVIEVLQGLPKGRKIDDIVRVLTELDVDVVTLVAAERSISRPPAARFAALHERLAAVGRAAAQQARRPRLPEIRGPIATPNIVAIPGRVLLVADPNGDARPLAAVAAELETVAVVGVLIGPEGGWSEPEIEHLRGQGARPVRLGRTVLRTEHAGAPAAAVLAAVLGRW